MLPTALSRVPQETGYSFYGQFEDVDERNDPICEDLKQQEDVEERGIPDRATTPPPDPHLAPAVGLVTPPQNKKRAVVEITPEKNTLAREMLRSMDPDDAIATLPRSEQDVLQQGIQSITEATDTPIKKKRSNVAMRTYAAFLNFAACSEESDSRSPTFHRKMSPTLLQSPWLAWMMKSVETIHRRCDHPVSGFPGLPDILVDLEHITSPQQGKKKKMGHHFCHPESPEYQGLVEKVIHRKTGVLYAKFDDGKGALKCSSYFPAWILNEEQLIEVLLSGVEMAKQNNRTLCIVNLKGREFVFEGYFRERADRRILNSAFPIFSFTDLCCPDVGDQLDIRFAETDLCMRFAFDPDSLIADARVMLQSTISASIDLRGLPANTDWQDEWMLRRPCIIDDSRCPIRYLLPATEKAPARLVFDFAEKFVERTTVTRGVLIAIPVRVLEDIPGCSAIVRAMTPISGLFDPDVW